MMVKSCRRSRNTSLYYADSHAHLRDELRSLDLLIKRRVIAFRHELQSMPQASASHPMYISHGEVDWLLERESILSPGTDDIEKVNKDLELLRSRINARIVESLKRGIFLSLPRLARLFALSDFELQAVIICLAPELERKYDKLYAYLQDDITRKKPSLDLILDLLCTTETDRWQARAYFDGVSSLFHAGIIHKTDDPQSPSGSSGLAQLLKLDPRILNYILGNNSIDERLTDIVKLEPPLPSLDSVFVDESIKTRLSRFIGHHFSENNTGRKKLELYFYGPCGAGKRELAQALCGQLKCPLLSLDLELLLAQEPFREETLRLIFREGLLLQAPVYVVHADILLREDDRTKALAKKLARVMVEYGWLTFLSGEKPWAYQAEFEGILFHAVEIPMPDVPIRKAAWQGSLKAMVTEDDLVCAGHLASQFRLTPGQIRDASQFAFNHRAMNNGQDNLTLSDLFAACRRQSNHKLAELALKIEPCYDWQDLVLPEDRLAQLKEICSQVKHRYTVYGEWGFGLKISHGRGLSVLFSGPSGTGKTMAAEVSAGELRLDLYKIDLSGVVSKYIGETEKNLDRVFREAQTSNAILFFDEADALFGKRTEVSDAHDRYANIETSYLLQKMEEYEGVVILATNLRENMDEAFTRRIRFIVEFPFPDEASRLRIWRTHFPKQAPVSDGIDYEFLSRQFQITGGNIRNIVLNAAFLAAENGGVIGMEQVLHGVKREYEKIGKIWTEKNLHQPLNLRS